MKKIKGSLSVEAALCLTTFIIVLFTILYFVKVIYIHERVQYAITQSAQAMSVGAYAIDKTGLLDLQQKTYLEAKGNLEDFSQSVEDLIFSYDDMAHTVNGLTSFNIMGNGPPPLINASSDSNELSQELFSERFQLGSSIVQGYTLLNELVDFIKISIEDTKQLITSAGVVPGLEVINNAIGTQIVRACVSQHISNSDYKRWGIVGGEGGMDYSRSSFMLEDEDIRLLVLYQVEIPFLKDILQPLSITQGVQVRAFTGNENFESAFESKEKASEDTKEEGEVVYITKNGQVYHNNRTCRYIDVKINAIAYKEVKDHKRICEICAKEALSLSDTSTVFSTSASPKYHTSKSCWTIKRDVMTILKEEAIKSNYRPCKLCGD